MSAHTTMCTGAAAMPPVAPLSTSASSLGVRRDSENARPCSSHALRVRSPIAARVCGSRTTTNSQGCRFSALGARVAASSSGASSSSVTGASANSRQRALPADDLEEVAVARAHEAARSPMRANVFTYMMRRLGANAHRLNASVSAPPMRSITSGVIALNARSGSSVSIS